MRIVTLVLSAVLGLIGNSNGNAQSVPYNPYAKPEAELPAVLPDGRLNWPGFFKSAAMESKYQSYFALGSCTGTKKSTVEMLRQNKVDVNALPESSVTGRVVGLRLGMVLMIDAAGVRQTIVTHPAGVSNVAIRGKLPPVELRAGMTVRIDGRVDIHGQSTEPLAAFDVLTPTAELKQKPIYPDTKQTIVGVIARVEAEKLRVTVAAGKLHRLTFPLAKTPSIDVQGSSLDLVAIGDEVKAFGHIYTGAGSLGAKNIFASKISVKKLGSPEPLVKASSE